MSAQLIPALTFREYDNNGNPLVNGLLYSYAAGTTTPQALYTDSTGSTQLPNPATFNFRGEVTGWANPSFSYKFVTTDSLGNVIRTVDNVNGQFFTQSIIPSAANTYTLGTPTTSWANLYLGPNGIAVYDGSSGGIGYKPQSTFESSAGAVITDFYYGEGDIRRYGATTSASNNALAIQTAVNVSGQGGAPAYIPPGTWAYTTTITLPLACSMYGAGASSILQPQGVDGLTFGAPTQYAGSRFFRDFQINGVNSTTNNGIRGAFTAASGTKILGIEFTNLTINGFGQGVTMRGLWNSVFRDCFLYNNYQGYLFNGQNVQVVISGGICQLGSAPGSGTSYGVLCNSTAGEDNQAITLTDGFEIYAYAIGVSAGPIFDLKIIGGTTINVCTNVGVQIVAAAGGLAIKDCYISTNNASFATIGISLNDLGSAVNDKATIDNNHLDCTAANAGSIGIYNGTNNMSTSITNNTVGSSTNAFVTGIQCLNNTNAFISANTIYATTNAVELQSSSASATVQWNTIQNGTALVLTGGTPTGLTYFSQGMSGVVTFASATTAAVTFSQAMPIAAYVALTSGNASGYTWITSQATSGFTINCSSSSSTATRWAISPFLS